ncbi:MAG: hypothetical protein CXB60_00840 [Spiroplasma poulsonii]|nr:hypothetical protein [Spiroplasma poulsonii]
MAKTVIQISQEQQIYLQESLSNKTYKDVCDEFIELCKKLSLDDYKKVNQWWNILIILSMHK